MAKKWSAQHSLRRRITVATLLIFLFSIWALSYYASRMLREDMERLLADQQSSTVSYVAAELNEAVEERVQALEATARLIDPSMLQHPAILQKDFEKRPLLQAMFNSGIVVTSLDGTALIDVPVVAGRRGTSYASNAATHAALTQGKSAIGRPLVGRVLKQPLFNINAPILDGHGNVIGALFGVIDLTKPNFLDHIGAHRYGKSGGYLVIDQPSNLIVTATDKSRILQALPVLGANEMNDRRRQGFLDSAISNNSLGVEVLSSASRVPVAGWLVVATLPTEEAFAPINEMQRRIVFAAILLTFVAGALSWWLLRRQFAPMQAAAERLSTMSASNQPPRPLPIHRPDEIGQLVGGFNRLLTALGQRETQLKTERDFFSALLKQSSDAILLLDAVDLQIRELNPSSCRMLGYTRAELLGMKYSELLDAEQDGETENAGQILQGGPPMLVERVFRTKDGASLSVEVNAGLVETAERKLIMVNIRDLSAHKQIEHALRETNMELDRAKAAAEKASVAKSDFLSNMSHELRSPLTAVLGFAQLMEFQTPPPSAEQRESIAQILKAGWHLLSLINEILDLAKIESGRVTLSLEPVSLSDVLQDCQAMIDPLARQRGIQMSFPSFDHRFHVHADRTRVKQVVINLLSNAIKYNRIGGKVIVQCGMSGGNRLRVSVADTGIGLAPQELAQLFQSFNRLGQDGGTEEGTGIGLVVTKRLIELMGGVVGVESEAGIGSTFWFDLTASTASTRVVGNMDDTKSHEDDYVPAYELSFQHTVLYVDDDPTNILLVEQLIALRSDLVLLTADDGHRGIDMARAHQPDLILMDIRMRGISGFGALKLLREDPSTAHIPVMALSANAVTRDIEMGIEAGFFCYLTKPIKVSEFMDALDFALRCAAENRRTT